jgi:4-amino-4-deoxy-L-arabinose transferase-like glycosyltransferase
MDMAPEGATLVETSFAQSARFETPRVRPQPVGSRSLYILIFAAGFLLRFGFMLRGETFVTPTAYEVMSIADHLVRGQGFSSPFLRDTGPTAWIAPAYPYLAALIFRWLGTYSPLSNALILSVQCLMGACTGIAIFVLGKRIFGAQIGFWAAWIWTVSPFFFRWATSWIWDTAFSALALTIILILTLDLAEKGGTKRWFSLGAVWGLSALTNPALLSLLPLTLAYAARANVRATRKWVRGCTFSVLVFAAMISPWLIRNFIVFKHPVFLRSNYWFEFHLGNYHYSNGMGFSGKHPSLNSRELDKYQELGEIEYVRSAREDALRFVREHPVEFAALTLGRIRWFWDGSFLPFQPSREWWKPWEYWPLSALGLMGLLLTLTRRPKGWPVFASPILIYPFPYYLAYPTARYRHAIEPLLLLLSVYFISVVWSELHAKFFATGSRARADKPTFKAA